MRFKDFFKISILFLSLGIISLSANARSGDGWSSSGGGEYIIDKNNPWFMGRMPVRWCVNHGGVQNFSLPEKLSKVEVEKGIMRIVNQLKLVEENRTDFADNENYSDFIIKKCGVELDKETGNFIQNCGFNSANILFISTNYEYVEKCKDAELEVILGNVDDSKVKNLISDLGVEKFRRMAGVAIRTSYDRETLRGKGFIYIAADLGKYSYTGSRAIRFKGNSIWDFHTKLNDKAAIPNNVVSSFFMYHPKEWSLKNATLSALQPVVAHEFGHVVGLQHNTNRDLMDADYPAEVLKNGLVFYGNLIRDANVISNSMLEEEMERRMAFEYSCDVPESCISYSEEIKEKHPLAYEMFFKYRYSLYEDEDQNLYNQKTFIVFDTEEGSSFLNGKLKILVINPETLKYEIKKTYDVEISFQKYLRNFSTISVRVENFIKNLDTWVYDVISGNWKVSEKVDEAVNETFPIISLMDHVIIKGSIEIDSSTSKNFELEILNHKKMAIIHMLDSERKRVYSFKLNRSHMANTFKYGIPEPRPEYYFYNLSESE